MIATRVGYAGGSRPHPTYSELGDHSEALEIAFDPARVSYGQLLERFFTLHDPTSRSWSRQYRAALFAVDDAQEREAAAVRDAIALRLGRPVHTPIERGGRFWPAEDYHQKYQLRRQRELLAELTALHGSEERALASTLAARLNGLAGGHGTVEEALAELERLAAPGPARERLRGLIAGWRSR